MFSKTITTRSDTRRSYRADGALLTTYTFSMGTALP